MLTRRGAGNSGSGKTFGSVSSFAVALGAIYGKELELGVSFLSIVFIFIDSDSAVCNFLGEYRLYS